MLIKRALKFIIFAVFVFVFTTVGETAFGANTEIYINGRLLPCEIEPIIREGRTLVPLRAVGEGMGLEVGYDNGMITITNGGISAVLNIGSNAMYVYYGDGSNEAVFMETPAILYNGYTMVSIRYVVTAFGGDVAWDDIHKTVIINYVSGADYGGKVSLYAGIYGARGSVDGDMLINSTFSAPSSIAGDNGIIYVVDGNKIRRIDNGYISTFNVDSNYIQPLKVGCNGGVLYFVSYPFADEEGNEFYAVFKYSCDSFFCITPQLISVNEFGYVNDMDIANDGSVYLLCGGKNIIKIAGELQSPQRIASTDKEFASLTVDDKGGAYLSAFGSSIYKLDTATGELKLFAGNDVQRGYADGKNPLFNCITDIAAEGGFIFVADSGRIRRISIDAKGRAEEAFSYELENKLNEIGVNLSIEVSGRVLFAADLNNCVIWKAE